MLSQDRPMRLKTPLAADVLQVVRLRGHEAISEPFSYTLDLIAEARADVPFDKLIGQPVTLTLKAREGEVRYFSGMVTQIAQGDSDKEFAHFQVNLSPAFALLRQRVRSRVFQDKGVNEILKTILDEFRLEGFRCSFALSKNYPRNYCVQYQESDFAFACRLMEDEGIHYYFRHDANGHELVVSDADLTHPDVSNLKPVAYDPTEAASPRIRQWSRAQKVTPGKWKVWDYNFQNPESHLAGAKDVPETMSFGGVNHRLVGSYNRDLEIFEGTGGYAWRMEKVGKNGLEEEGQGFDLFKEATRIVEVRMQEGTADAVTASGTGDASAFTPGFVFTLQNHPRDNGKYLLAAVEHEADQGGFHSGEDATFSYKNRFSARSAAASYRPSRRTPRPTIPGPQTAVVVGPEGKDTYVDLYGRVKVQFHWEDKVPKTNDGSATCWVRVGQIWAGKKWGAFFWPRIGHEVIVVFEEGNPDRPLIVGSVYNATNKPPFDLPDNDLLSGIKSCSAGGDSQAHSNFNRLLFNDQAGDELLEVHSERAQRITTEADQTLRAGTKWTTVVGSLGNLGGSGSGGGMDPAPQAVGSGSGGGFVDTLVDTVKATHPGRKYDFVVGTSSIFTLGAHANHVVGQKLQVTTHPAAFAQWTSKGWGSAALQGFIVGAGYTDLQIGGGFYAKYGPVIDVHRGPSLATAEKPKLLVTALAAVVDGIAIAGTIAAATAPDFADKFFIAGKAAETVAMGLLGGYEAKSAWLKHAEALTDQADFCTEIFANGLGRHRWMGPAMYDSDDVQAFSRRILDAVKGGDYGLTVHNCQEWGLAAHTGAYLAVLGENEYDKSATLTIASRGKLKTWANEQSIYADDGLQLNGGGKCSVDAWDLELAGGRTVALKVNKNMPKAPSIKMDRAEESITLAVGNTSLEMTADYIILKVDDNEIGVTKQGLLLDGKRITVEGEKIDIQAKTKLSVSAALYKEDITGVVERKAAVEKNQ